MWFTKAWETHFDLSQVKMNRLFCGKSLYEARLRSLLSLALYGLPENDRGIQGIQGTAPLVSLKPTRGFKGIQGTALPALPETHQGIHAGGEL